MVPAQSVTDTASGTGSDDRELLGGVAAKDEAAFERLYKRYYHRVLQFVGRMVKDRRTAEEVVDDTMFAVWKSAQRFEGRSNVSTWIFGIAYRRALKTIDSNKRHRFFENDSDKIDLTADQHPASSPESAVAATDLRRQIDGGIEQLSDEHRAVMLLTAMGYDYGEIAAIVDCPANTVKTRMFYARKNLRNILSAPIAGALTDRRQLKTWSHNTQIS